MPQFVKSSKGALWLAALLAVALMVGQRNVVVLAQTPVAATNTTLHHQQQHHVLATLPESGGALGIGEPAVPPQQQPPQSAESTAYMNSARQSVMVITSIPPASPSVSGSVLPPPPPPLPMLMMQPLGGDQPADPFFLPPPGLSVKPMTMPPAPPMMVFLPNAQQTPPARPLAPRTHQPSSPPPTSYAPVNGGGPPATVVKMSSPKPSMEPHQHTRNHHFDGFTEFDKEVVERLIKRWAPVVWLAPEEKFMPMGVEEFLEHVHPMDKGKTLMAPGMPIGDTSTKAYLVTNAEIDDLLENEDSFIYGRNPNDSPVPIYAVVSLCNSGQQPQPQQPPQQPVGATSQPPQMHHESNVAAPAAAAAATSTFLFGETPMHATSASPQQQQSHFVASTRNPYIPVSLDPLEAGNHTQRRSSRFYPAFKRVVQRRSVGSGPPPSPSSPSVDYRRNSSASSSSPLMYQEPAEPLTEADPATVNNFIANLVDNVKFSSGTGSPVAGGVAAAASMPQLEPNDLDNNINGQYEGAGAAPLGSADLPDKVPPFHVTYWMFYPYSQGKSVCTLNLGPLGSIPFPAVYGFCLGRRKDIGSHIGDWEHMSLFFNGGTEPEAMYVSAHDAGAYYVYNRLTGSFEFKKQETRKGILQRPNFPKTVTTFDNHPVLFAAKGSHGLWTAPGKHRFVKVARLYDINGFGTPWNTWKAVDITYENLKSYGRSLIPAWLAFKGKWGNPKSKCHPFRRIGLNFCEFTDGPTGIPLKEPHFQCNAGAMATYRR